MAVSQLSKKATPLRLLTPAAWAVLLTGARRFCGFVALLLAGALAAALASYHPGDPSLNTAAPHAAENWLGRPGAVAADLMLQAAGLASAWPVVLLAAWGGRLMSGRRPSAPWLRMVALLTGLGLTAVGLAALPTPYGWSAPGGLGGAGGALSLRALDAMARRAGAPSIAVAAMAAALGILGAFLAFWACMLRGREWAVLWRVLIRAAGAAVWIGAAQAPRRAASSLERLRGFLLPLPQAADPQAADPQAARHYEDGRAQPDLDCAPETCAIVGSPPKRAPSRRDLRARQASFLPDDSDEGSILPSLDLLAPSPTVAGAALDRMALSNNARMLEGVLKDFGVKGRIVEVRPGPVVTLYELEPAPGVKTNRVIGLAEDIARAMSALSVRIAVTPGASTIGVELPNARREMVNFRALLAADAYHNHSGQLVLALGCDIGGAAVYVDLARMPHLLIAGTTGSGKSVAVNTMICSLLYRVRPDQCRFIMIDPKMLELSAYDGVPHLLTPVVTDPGKAVTALKWAVKEMETRYRAMSRMGVRNIASYNQKLRDAAARGETLTRTVQTGFDPETGEPVYEDRRLEAAPLPFIVVIVDEMADLMLVAGKDVEAAIQRLAQMARAAGVHLIMATQRPSVDVITGTIKANFPTRISFQVTSKIDSRTILGEQGAEQLLGQGDMLYMAAGGRVSRVHGPFLSDGEVEAIAAHLRAGSTPEYVSAVTEEDEQGPSSILDAMTGSCSGEGGDALFDQAVALIARERKASTSFIQRHLQIGYNRAARIIERMEKEGMVSKANSVGKREVLLPPPAQGA